MNIGGIFLLLGRSPERRSLKGTDSFPVAISAQKLTKSARVRFKGQAGYRRFALWI